MVNVPSVPEIITVNSEVLQTQIRDLLPSQNGFGSELQATNVITPIIDLTAAAEGSGLNQLLQNAIAFGSQTAFEGNNTPVVLANSPGFYRIFGVASIVTASGSAQDGGFTMTDGSTTKIVWQMKFNAAVDTYQTESFDFVVWLAAGESISAVSNNVASRLCGSIRQIADSSGQSVNPSGYPL
jgi:hypothetical protein